MLQFTCVSKPVTNWLHVLRPLVHQRNHLVFCWRLVCQAIYQDKARLKGGAVGPAPYGRGQLRRLLTATYWHGRVLVWWFADHVIATLPAPDDGVCYLVIDSTLQDKSGQKHPLATTGRLNE